MIKDLLDSEEEPALQKRSAEVVSLFDDADEEKEKEPFVLSQAEPESTAETVRRSGMAYSAGIALFASVVFMLVIGWGADLLFGSSPWGIVIGIIIGAAIGFIQFFRITSQIFKK
ncbi:MAG TPA: AtpZ/AtpI family protein [Pyrinomonadaceae bacterium]|nr:AtpZ/AtpI family protein [Pyrinomonadaceae bacterium]